MRRMSVMLILTLCACGKAADRTPRDPAAQPPVPAPIAQSNMPGNRATAKMAMMEVPSDKRQLERLVAMGYTVHENHLHPPGVKSCPFDMGGSVVQ